MKIPALFQLRILNLALRSLFSRAYTMDFPRKPFEARPEFRGRPRYHEEDCIGCTACANVCPSGCIDVIDEPAAKKPVRKLVHHHDRCVQCGQCQRCCTTEKGIILSNEWNFSGYSSEEFTHGIEKELLLCEVCGGILAPKDQIKWLAERLGPLAFCNPTVMLVSHKELAVVDEGIQKNTEFPERAKRINIQCPHCRRKTSFTA
ncbi:MAG: 4Fe-4S dicluster domain-containing protein [Chitinivibrionales bacterium]|nr:4Fe-4S dicluster domain-containing protein [Chitinivibrionales bacterium]